MTLIPAARAREPECQRRGVVRNGGEHVDFLLD